MRLLGILLTLSLDVTSLYPHHTERTKRSVKPFAIEERKESVYLKKHTRTLFLGMTCRQTKQIECVVIYIAILIFNKWLWFDYFKKHKGD